MFIGLPERSRKCTGLWGLLFHCVPAFHDWPEHLTTANDARPELRYRNASPVSRTGALANSYNESEASGLDGRPGLPGRKVRTPQSSVPDNVRDSSVKAGRRPVPQKTYRPAQAVVRVKRCGKSAPPGQQWSGHGKPHTEQDQIGRESASTDTHRLGASGPSGRSHEHGSDAAPRGMIVIPRKRNTEFGLQVHLFHFLQSLPGPARPYKFLTPH